MVFFVVLGVKLMRDLFFLIEVCMFGSVYVFFIFLIFFFFLQNPLEGHEIAFNKFVVYLRSVVDHLFPIVPHPPKYAWFVTMCVSLFTLLFALKLVLLPLNVWNV